jgi:hypothetical protein
VPHEFHVLAGSHQGDQYWAHHGAEYLRFTARALTVPVRATARAGA